MAKFKRLRNTTTKYLAPIKLIIIVVITYMLVISN